MNVFFFRAQLFDLTFVLLKEITMTKLPIFSGLIFISVSVLHLSFPSQTLATWPQGYCYPPTNSPRWKTEFSCSFSSPPPRKAIYGGRVIDFYVFIYRNETNSKRQLCTETGVEYCYTLDTDVGSSEICHGGTEAEGLPISKVLINRSASRFISRGSISYAEINRTRRKGKREVTLLFSNGKRIRGTCY